MVGCGLETDSNLLDGCGVVCVCDQDHSSGPGGDRGVWSASVSQGLRELVGRRWNLFDQAVTVEHWWRDKDGGACARGLDGRVIGAVCGHGPVVDGTEGVFAEAGMCLGMCKGLWPLLRAFLLPFGSQGRLRGGGRFCGCGSVPGGRQEVPEGGSGGVGTGAEGVPFVHVTRGGGSQDER